MDYVVVPAADAADIKVGKQAAWKGRLIAGDMLSMVKRPSWTKDDAARTGMKMRSRQYTDEAGEVRFYVWLEKADAEEMTSMVVGVTPPFESDDDSPVPL